MLLNTRGHGRIYYTQATLPADAGSARSSSELPIWDIVEQTFAPGSRAYDQARCKVVASGLTLADARKRLVELEREAATPS